MNIMLRGFNALTAGRDLLPENYEPLLVRGPAYGAMESNSTSAAGDWPTYRQNGARTGVAAQAVPAALTTTWQVAVGGQLSPPVVAQGRVIVAAVDRQTVHCLDDANGKPVWTFSAGGRVDSPPTIAGPRVLFGCRDGRVYCVRLADGALVWRLRAAPAERQIIADGQLESSWPLHGRVLVEKGVAYVAAGRATRLDGGIRLWALEPATGRVLQQAVLDTPERTTPLKDNRDPQERTGFVSDILVADGGETHEGRKPKNPLPTKFKDPGDNAPQRDATSSAEDKARPHPLPSNLWTQRCDLRMRALVLAGQTLILAGPPDKIDPRDPYATFDGRSPAKLRLASTANGQTLKELDLDSPPVWDGLAAANGRLYLSTMDGKVSCFAGTGATK